MAKLTEMEEVALERAARNVANKMVIKCKNNQPQNIETCVSTRILGIEYMNDIINELPENHKYKEDQESIYDMIDTLRTEAMSYIK